MSPRASSITRSPPTSRWSRWPARSESVRCSDFWSATSRKRRQCWPTRASMCGGCTRPQRRWRPERGLEACSKREKSPDMNARFHASRVGQGMCVVTGEREAHAQTAEDLREALSAAVAGGCKRVLVDLQGTEHIDPLVLGAILGSRRRLSHFGGEMAVLCESDAGFA